ncbi:hypothetical protein SAMN04487821_1594 [Enterococcus malodoratus]|uniref:hypothetical protein n=1 Tax=Enterococcus malodoratus TaxID=71451 RepID=UPI0008D351AD|nr:hypothetical protein [Enterococcus malodoratus]SEU03100.1 hypothetical protein SAMN04487821_1594 [Enterococcus malodoratus]
MNIEKLTKKVQYYEKLTRQYKEAQDFLQALQCTNPENPREGLLRKTGFDEYAEIQISTPAVLFDDHYTTDLIYKVNLSKDLGMDFVNSEINDLLIQRVGERLMVIEDELLQAFDGMEDGE